MACKQIIAVVNYHGSRGALKGLTAHLKLIHHEIGVIHTDLQTVEPDDEALHKFHLKIISSRHSFFLPIGSAS
jgi:hypothetical protein